MMFCVITCNSEVHPHLVHLDMGTINNRPFRPIMC